MCLSQWRAYMYTVELLRMLTGLTVESLRTLPSTSRSVYNFTHSYRVSNRSAKLHLWRKNNATSLYIGIRLYTKTMSVAMRELIKCKQPWNEASSHSVLYIDLTTRSPSRYRRYYSLYILPWRRSFIITFCRLFRWQHRQRWARGRNQQKHVILKVSYGLEYGDVNKFFYTCVCSTHPLCSGPCRNIFYTGAGRAWVRPVFAVVYVI